MGLDQGAALLDARGYRHTGSGFWFDRTARKAFTDEYVRHHEVGQLEADLTEDTRGTLKLYSDWPITAEAQREIDRLMGDLGGWTGR
jgi:hypothetical protein